MIVAKVTEAGDSNAVDNDTEGTRTGAESAEHLYRELQSCSNSILSADVPTLRPIRCVPIGGTAGEVAGLEENCGELARRPGPHDVGTPMVVYERHCDHGQGSTSFIIGIRLMTVTLRLLNPHLLACPRKCFSGGGAAEPTVPEYAAKACASAAQYVAVCAEFQESLKIAQESVSREKLGLLLELNLMHLEELMDMMELKAPALKATAEKAGVEKTAAEKGSADKAAAAVAEASAEMPHTNCEINRKTKDKKPRGRLGG